MKILDSYLAGLFDGEGYISVRPKKSDKTNIQGHIGITMTNQDIIQKIYQNYGGNFRVEKPRKEGYLYQYVWDIYGKKAENIIQKIIPFLIVKREPALLFIEFINLPRLHSLGRRGGICDCIECLNIKNKRVQISDAILNLNKN